MLNIKINSFSYAETPNKPVLEDILLSLKQGEHIAVMGKSGCGKSTLLHIIYGLLSLNDGRIDYKEKQLLGPTHNLIPGEPFMKLVSQELDLMPFTSVAENIASNLDRNNIEQDNTRVDELLDVVKLKSFKRTKVKNLSGGQKQRVAIAKALAQLPEVLLLDEPFSSIDTFLKNTLRRSIFKYTRDQNITCVISTHDSEEALSFSDQVLILKDGEIEKLGTPQEVYNTINNKYAASFFGDVSHINGRVYLPHQLKISEEKTDILMLVEKSYYQGERYLIEGRIKNEKGYVFHDIELLIGAQAYVLTNDSY